MKQGVLCHQRGSKVFSINASRGQFVRCCGCTRCHCFSTPDSAQCSVDLQWSHALYVSTVSLDSKWQCFSHLQVAADRTASYLLLWKSFSRTLSEADYLRVRSADASLCLGCSDAWDATSPGRLVVSSVQSNNSQLKCRIVFVSPLFV